MSGSGGGGYIPPQRNKFDCETSFLTTSVSSIDIAVLEKHKEGVLLDVIVDKKGALVLEDGDGEILGAILHSNTSDIIECMENGAVYEAEIKKINTPACTVKVYRK